MASIAVRRGLPSVSVPVLSTTSVSTASNRSSASASRISTPARAPAPTPTMIAIGVARPSAQGQAMISTDTAATSAKAKRGSGPKVIHATKARTAAAPTSGTNQPATRSARRCAGARLRWALATRSTMRASAVSRPTFSARMTRPPEPLTVAADQLRSDRLHRRHRLAGHHGFVDRARAVDHFAVDGDFLARTHAQSDRRPRPLRARPRGRGLRRRRAERASARGRGARGWRRRSFPAPSAPEPARRSPAA